MVIDMRRLTDETLLYKMIMSSIKFVKLDCWNHKAPKGFDKA